MFSHDKHITFVCRICGADVVTRDAWAEWDTARQCWSLGAAFAYAYCHFCEGETRLVEVAIDSQLTVA